MSTIDITAVTQLRLTALLTAVKKMGSQSALAKHLGVPQTEMSAWCRMRRVPNVDRWSPEKRQDIEQKLLALTGQTLDLIFPEDLRRSTAFLNAPKQFERTQSIELSGLLHYASATRERLTYDPVNEAISAEKHELIAQLLPAIPARYSRVLELRFGLNGNPVKSFEQIGVELGVCAERVRQLEVVALELIRKERALIRPLVSCVF